MIDLHTHSTASDGSDSPTVLVQKAKDAGLSAIALTDHDTVSGLPEFLAAGEREGIRTIPGVEISTWLNSKELHIAGLFIDWKAPELLSLLEQFREERKIRNLAILSKLQELGYDITEDSVKEAAGGESIGRPHIARALVSRGYFETIQDVFDALLKRGRAAFVPRNLPHPEVAAAAIHRAGGLAIWAHPVSGLHSGERSYVRKMLKGMEPAHLDGMETRYSTFTANQTSLLEELVSRFHLLSSGGSDYHGLNQLGTRLGTGTGGLLVPDEFLERMDEARAKVQAAS